MAASMNKVMLVGQVGKYAFALRQTSNGSSYAVGSITVTETGQDGREHSLYVPCHVYGKRAVQATELAPGAAVLCEGRLSLHKGKENTWSLVVSTFSIAPVAASPRRQATAGQPAMDDEDLPF